MIRAFGEFMATIAAKSGLERKRAREREGERERERQTDRDRGRDRETEKARQMYTEGQTNVHR